MKKIIVASAALMLLLCGCSGGSEGEVSVLSQQPSESSVQESAAPGLNYKQISQSEAMKIMEEQTGYIILDVRTLDEFAQGHIPGAICVPNENIGTSDVPQLRDRSQMILVYCRSGRRSKEAAKKLADIGYTNVLEFGGINDWQGKIITGYIDDQ